MTRLQSICFGVIVSGLTGTSPIQASPEQDRIQFRPYYQMRFPDVPLTEFTNGVYAINHNTRGSWQASEAFPSV